jgi:hypothetical protein
VEGTTNVPQLDGQKLYLKVPHQDVIIDFDSCEVIHGNFCMDGEVDSIMLGSIYLGGESLMPIVVEKGKIRISIENSRLEVSGTPLNERLYDFIKRKNILEERLSEVQHNQMQLIIEGTSADEAEKLAKEEEKVLVNEMNTLIADFVIGNFDNVLAQQIFSMYCQSFPRPMINSTIRQIIEKAPDTFKQDEFVKEYANNRDISYDLYKFRFYSPQWNNILYQNALEKLKKNKEVLEICY